MRSAVTAAAVVVCLPAGVRAECPTGVIPDALTARIDRSGLDALQGVFLGRLPTELPLPEGAYTVFECPDGLFDDTIVGVGAGIIALAFHDVRIGLHEGAIEIDAELDIATATDLDLELCAMPDAVCHAELQSEGIAVHARIEPSVTACTPHLPITELDIVIPAYATVVQLSRCGLYDDAAGLVYDWFREWIVDLVTTELEAAIRESLPAAVEALTTELVADGVDLLGMRFDVAAQGLEVAWDGITLTAAANITPLAIGDCLPSGAALPNETKIATAATLSSAMISVAASEPFLQRAVGAAWLTGLLCFDTRDYDLDLGADLVAFAPDPTLAATVSLPEAPTVQLGEDHSITIAASVLEAELTVGTSVSDPVVVGARMSAAISGYVGLDYVQQNLVLRLDDARSDGLAVSVPDSEVLFSAEGLSSLVDNLVLPAFADNLGPLPLTSSLLVYAPIGVRLNQVGVIGGTHLRADLEITAVDVHDSAPPLTIVDDPPELSAAGVAIGLASVDDTTPSRFVRHAVTVDGAEEDELAGGTLLELDLMGGHHEIEVAAVDLNGNRDETPVRIGVHVDDQSPEVRVVEAPIGLIFEDRARILVEAGDDHTDARDLRMRYTVATVTISGPDLVFEDGPLDYREAIELANLPEDSIVRVTIYAVDAVGNAGSTAVSFAVNTDPDFSCRATPVGWAGVLLAGVLLVLALRTRRRAGTAV